MLILKTGGASEDLRVPGIDDDEGHRLVRIVRRAAGGGDVAAGAHGAAVGACMDVAAIAKVAFTSEDRIRDVVRICRGRYQPKMRPEPKLPGRRIKAVEQFIVISSTVIRRRPIRKARARSSP